VPRLGIFAVIVVIFTVLRLAALGRSSGRACGAYMFRQRIITETEPAPDMNNSGSGSCTNLSGLGPPSCDRVEAEAGR
jgi:hypothetical protein